MEHRRRKCAPAAGSFLAAGVLFYAVSVMKHSAMTVPSFTAALGLFTVHVVGWWSGRGLSSVQSAKRSFARTASCTALGAMS